MPEPPVDLSAGGLFGNKNKFSVNINKKKRFQVQKTGSML